MYVKYPQVPWPAEEAYFKAIPLFFVFFPFPLFSFICWFGSLQAPECFTADFAFPNVVFPKNEKNAHFPGSVPVAFFVTKLAGEF